MTNQVIPTEAVEAAWDKLHENPRHPIAIQYSELQAALEAAAPHMRAAAWEEGMLAMYESTSSEWPPIPERNPYRPTE